MGLPLHYWLLGTGCELTELVGVPVPLRQGRHGQGPISIEQPKPHKLILGAVDLDSPFPSWPGDSPGHLPPHVVEGCPLLACADNRDGTSNSTAAGITPEPSGDRDRVRIGDAAIRIASFAEFA